MEPSLCCVHSGTSASSNGGTGDQGGKIEPSCAPAGRGEYREREKKRRYREVPHNIQQTDCTVSTSSTGNNFSNICDMSCDATISLVEQSKRKADTDLGRIPLEETLTQGEDLSIIGVAQEGGRSRPDAVQSLVLEGVLEHEDLHSGIDEYVKISPVLAGNERIK
jgi:hypothetical protein